MQLEVHQIPKSFQGYIDQFEAEPATALERLENHVLKRNAGAVGYFFLAWLYHRHGENRKAIQAALQAKMLAPGSKLMEKLHYLLAHPRSFNAWEPEPKRGRFRRENHSYDMAHPIQDLDLLIARLSSVERKHIKPGQIQDGDQPDLSEQSTQVDDIVTETLAVIHEKQKNYLSAIETYKKLRASNPSKEEHYSEQIFRLQQKIEENKKEK
jgi:tetratricopeptide (TPR) repeat protein